MKTTTALTGGLAGALTLNLIHETYRKIDKDAPHIQLIGEEVLVKLLKAANLPLPATRKDLYGYTLAGDILSNALYYSLIGLGKKKHLFRHGLFLGLAAGAGTVFLPSKMNLNQSHSDRTAETKMLTILWYTLGGLAAAGAIRFLLRKK